MMDVMIDTPNCKVIFFFRNEKVLVILHHGQEFDPHLVN
jgi:hypothetical protein